MKGGLRKVVEKKKEYLFNEYALELIRDTLSNIKLPKMKQDGGDFLSDFNSWIKTEADPIHDFKMSHKNFNKSISKKILIRTYDEILKRKSVDFENEVLIRLLQDPNTDQGISLKYCRFYKLTEEDEEISLWKKIEDEFDNIDQNVKIKFYILNASIKGTGSRKFTQEYKKITPLSVYWDPLPARPINFRTENNQEFNNIVYDEINKELHAATGIRFRINEGDNDKEIILSLETPNRSYMEYKMERQGFSVNEIKRTIEQIANKEVITEPTLKMIITFLRNNGSNDNDIISFLLICKMSGDIGSVYFIKLLDTYNGVVKFNNIEVDYKVSNKPITFIYTTDRLCGTIAIANDVKCVVRCKPLNDVFICQYVGSKGKLHESVYEPYYDILQRICKINFRGLTQEEKDRELLSKYFTVFVATFSLSNYTVRSENDHARFSHEVLDRLEFVEDPIRTDDDRIRHILAIVSLNDLKKKLGDTIKYVIKYHDDKIKPRNIIALNYLNENTDFFNPLLEYFMNTLIIPNESIKEYVYKYITKEIEKHIKITFTTNYKSLSVLQEHKKKKAEINLDEDIGMVDTDIYQNVKGESSKRKSKPKPKAKKKNDSDDENDADYVPSD